MNTATQHAAPPAETPSRRVWRIEIHPADPADDPVGQNVLREARDNQLAPSLTDVRSARIFLIETDSDQPDIQRIADQLLADPINQRAALGAQPTPDDAQIVEVHYLPGVMDPVADSTKHAITELLDLTPDHAPEVRTGTRYDMIGASHEDAQRIALRLLANPVIQSLSFEAFHPDTFTRGQPVDLHVRHIPITTLNDDGLRALSRSGHLFLSLEEMKAIQSEYQSVGREPTDIELETLAQTWSEHCVHKTLKSRIHYHEHQPTTDIDWSARPGHTVQPDGSVVIDNLLKSTIAAATQQLRADGVDWCISVFVDNAGVIAFDDNDAITFKVETHNHPSALEPYGGAATGIGGCIRDTMGTGLAAKPIASTDIFCVAHPDGWTTPSADQDQIATDHTAALPKGVLHPKRILTQVVAGVRDYGNRMGIPTVNGAVYFDDRYLGNPLVFCGSIGLIPRDLAFGDAQPGDRIIALGGRTGRDGIHGATFSSAELTDTHADEFSHAVQIGNAITQKKTLDVILAARDLPDGPIFHAITDCGAGGFSSAVGEMGENTGAAVQLDRAPLKYDGLTYTDIWISEAQERMVLAVPSQHVDQLLTLADDEDVESCDLGQFTDDRQLVLNYHDTEVGRLGMEFLHGGFPQLTREATWNPTQQTTSESAIRRATTSSRDTADLLLTLLSHPNIASKHWIIRQYDHEVQGGSVVKPLAGPAHGPSDAAVIRPKLDSAQGIALSVGLATALGDVDPYQMTLAAIDEAVRNLVCVGARPDRIALLDNFCWANCQDPAQLGALVRAAEACYDGALAYRAPFISGKDSLNNEFKLDTGQTIAIPPTLLISAVGHVDDTAACLTMDAKSPGNLLLQVGGTSARLAGAHLNLIAGATGIPTADQLPKVDLQRAPQQAAVIARLIAERHIRAAHDCSEGGMLVAAAEMALAGDLGLQLDLAGVPALGPTDHTAACFAETPSRILIEIEPHHFDPVAQQLSNDNIPFGQIGTFTPNDRFTVRCDDRGRIVDISVADLAHAWRKTLDW
ncbi:MAG: phosphoribosylformylglycinamidine synthase [Planctomycetaceae bacterium]|nr:phosphoribosylformylglycinamidine synthase [Planctomycetaceae bacterium]